MKRSLLAPAIAALSLACGSNTYPEPTGPIPFEPQRPDLVAPGTATPYTGMDPFVLEAQTRYPTGVDLHRKLVMRTCSGTNGVCHNQKEYPDLHTPATFAASIDAPCNVASGTWDTVYDRCERLGDRFRFAEESFREIEIGWFEFIPGETPDFGETGTKPDASTPGLHLYLYDPIPLERERVGATGTFIRNFIDDQGNVQGLAFASYDTRWWMLDDRRHVFAEVSQYQRDRVEGLVASGIVQGDQNRNGVFGARTGTTVPLINPGKPEESYLVARLRGYMGAESVPGTRMPLANQPPSTVDMLALMCFIEGLDPGAAQWNLSSAIDYTQCSYSADPQSLTLVGNGVTWRQRVLPILQSNCGGCHGGSNPQAGLDLLAEDAYQRVLQASTQKPELKLIQPGEPQQSYLYRKLVGDGSITGTRMPINPLNGDAPLPTDQLDAISDWITAGAQEDG